jgi:hypothetical protein
MVLSAALWSSLAFSQSLPGNGIPYVPPMAAEGVDLELNTSGAGEVISIRITECDGCMPRTFLPGPEIEFRSGGEQISVRQAKAASGGGGTVLYDRETELAEVVIFYGQ